MNGAQAGCIKGIWIVSIHYFLIEVYEGLDEYIVQKEPINNADRLKLIINKNNSHSHSDTFDSFLIYLIVFIWLTDDQLM